MTDPCPRCGGPGWVCEDHPDLPWADLCNRADACHCGGAGARCPDCNADGHKTGMVEIIADTKHGVRH